MQKRTVRRFLAGGTLLALSLPFSAWANDGATETPRIQSTLRDGKLYITNASPNPPLNGEESSTAAIATPSLDGRMPADIQSLVHSISKTHGIDPQLVAAVMKIESNYDRWARSSKGALGLMQLIPSTGMRFGVRDFYDPAQNIEGGVRYLKFLTDKFGPSNLHLILAAYNAGENLVARLNRVPSIPETVDYVRKIQTIYKPGGYKPGSAPALVSASDDVKPVVDMVPPEPKATKIYKSVDARGVIHFSSIGPPN
jgi:soluble lytic murein transglycosylase-like protein